MQKTRRTSGPDQKDRNDGYGEYAEKIIWQQREKKPYLAVVHRLDQPVQGILVFGKNQKSGARLSEEMQKNEMEKIYLACVQGVPEKEEGILEDQMEKVPGSNLSRIVENKTKKQQKKLY